MTDAKHCHGCDQPKPLDEFGRRSASKDGRNSRCKACMRAYHRAYYQANKARRRAQLRRHYAAHRERYRDYARERRRKYPKKIAAYHAQWRRKNPHKVRAMRRRAYQRQKERQFAKIMWGD